MKGFGDCSFELTLPKGDFIGNKLHITLNFKYRKQKNEKIVFWRASLVDKLKYLFENEINTFCLRNLCNQHIDFDLSFVKQKPLMRDSQLKLDFLSESGIKTTVEYVFVNLHETHLTNITESSMNEIEKQVYIETIQNQAHVEDKQEFFEGEIHHKKTGMVASDIPGLEKYKVALEEEKRYLKTNGGKKYKVSSGRLVSESNGDFTYVFELETELYITDDSPVKLTVGINQYDGHVMLCEDFEIIIVLDKNIGTSISSAFINVEPWKLLEMLEEKLGRTIGFGGSIANKLLVDGAKLATKEPIEKIPKGQDEVIKRAEKEPVTIVWGPPGTGKTHTMSELAIRFLKQGKKILIVSHSNYLTNRMR